MSIFLYENMEIVENGPQFLKMQDFRLRDYIVKGIFIFNRSIVFHVFPCTHSDTVCFVLFGCFFVCLGASIK